MKDTEIFFFLYNYRQRVNFDLMLSKALQHLCFCQTVIRYIVLWTPDNNTTLKGAEIN